MRTVSVLRYSLVLLGVGLGFTPLHAAELVPGGYGDPAAAFAADNLRAVEAVAPFVIEFTPRSAAALWLAAPQSPIAGRADLSAGASAPLLALGRLGLLEASPEDPPFLVGGALRLDDITLSASFGRPTLLGTPSQLFAAGMAVGGLSAIFGYATAAAPGAEALDMLMLQTGVTALPWLSFESQMLIGESVDTGPLAIGRIGVRVNF